MFGVKTSWAGTSDGYWTGADNETLFTAVGSNPGVTGTAAWSIAYEFDSPYDGTLSTVYLGLNRGASYTGTLYLYEAPNGNDPFAGTQLASQGFTIGTNGWANANNFAIGATLAKGTPYWLIMSVPTTGNANNYWRCNSPPLLNDQVDGPATNEPDQNVMWIAGSGTTSGRSRNSFSGEAQVIFDFNNGVDLYKGDSIATLTGVTATGLGAINGNNNQDNNVTDYMAAQVFKHIGNRRICRPSRCVYPEVGAPTANLLGTASWT